jgi:Short C-terminal domain
MKKLLFLILLCPLLSTAQKTLPRFENDTLYTSGGYKIYKGQILQFANGTSAAGYFRFIKFHTGMVKNNTYILQNGTMLVKSLKGYKYAGPENNNIRIAGTATYTDGKKEEVDILMNFERVITGIDGLPGELTVPAEFITSQTETVKAETKKQAVPAETPKETVTGDIKKLMVADEIKKLFDLYKAGALTKEEYEAQKKKLLERQ